MAANVAEASGGVADHVARLAEGLRGEGVAVDVAWRDAGFRLPGGLDMLATSLRVAHQCRRGRYDVLHTHAGVGVVAQHLAPARTARVVTSHGDERAMWRAEQAAARRGHHRIHPWSRLLMPGTRVPLFVRAVRDADVVIALHQGEADALERARGGAPATSFAIPNGCLPAGRPSDPEPASILYIGDWNWRKGPHELALALRHARARDARIRLTLAGPEAWALAAFDPRDRPHVRVTGWLGRPELEELLARADLLVLSSLFEGMPLVALDALAFGVPVVAFDLPGIRAGVGDAGRLAPAGRPDALGEALVALTGDRVERQRCAREARLRAARSTWAAVARATLGAYARAQARRSSRPLQNGHP